MTKISLVVPVFNEQDNIPVFYNAIRNIVWSDTIKVEIIFIDDGSKDATEIIINGLASQDELVIAISFTRNFGKESALYAGLEHANGDAVIPIDVDFQDPIELIPEMIKKWQQGASVVLAKRIDRSTDNFFKRITASLFYKLHNKISSPKIEENVGDFRLMSREVVDNVLLLEENNLFMKGILSWVGGDTEIIEYERQVRQHGHSKFNVWKLTNLAWDGITSFSTVPLRIWTYVGLVISTFTFIYGFWMVIQTLVWGNDVKGYPSTFVAIMFFGGVQLIGIGVLGEYIGRIYIETKRRPKYILKKKNKTNE